MRSFRHAIRLLTAGVLLIGVALATGPSAALATTGPSYYLPPSPYKVNSKVELLYIGQYIFARADRGARLHGGALGIEVNSRGQLHGIGQFYGYDDQGNQTTWVATLYNFHLEGKSAMVVDVLGATGKPLLARLYVTRSKKGDLNGQIEYASGRYGISWRKISGR